ncbi:hypothetical protein PAMA_014057 [Pampus argenteus]
MCHCSETLIRTMRSFTLITALLLCSLSWVSVSASESQIVDVQPGENVTLLCSSLIKSPTQTFWSRLVNKTKISCILYMDNKKNVDGIICNGFKNGKFSMSFNMSTVSLKITRVDLSDAGLYLCGIGTYSYTELQIVQLNVQGHDESSDEVNIRCKKESDGITKMTSVILGCVTVFLVTVVIGLVVKIRKLQTAPNEDQNTPQCENLSSDNLNYAALTFHPKPKRNRRPASGRIVEPNVIYAATR